MRRHLARSIGVACLILTSLSLPACFVILGDGGCGHEAPPNWKLPTLGGNQFWTDVFHRSGWRIQRHFATGHFRLLDTGGFRRAWGSRQNCEDRFDRLADSIPANRATVLILAHGLGRTSNCWGPMTRHVQAETDWQVVPFTYASTRDSIESHADALGQLIEGLGSEVQRIHFIGHSLGNIVMRRYLADNASNSDPRMG
ncbi:MAG: hypothetical protein P1U53_17905, partial [Sulfitobacter sp.]|nr:hypothetical protein [Sulfitobacter sp.]